MKTICVPSIEQRFLDTRLAFDSVAPTYGGPTGNNCLVQRMRAALCDTVEALASPGARLLDLGCGVGLDAAYFARQGYHVTAIDWSPEMVTQTRQRAEQAGLTARLVSLELGIQELDLLTGEAFDIVYSDLGALNCLPELEAFAQTCASLIRAGGFLVCSVIGRYCPWELVYFLLRGNMDRARVRFVPGQVPVNLNGHTVWTRYYSPREFYRPFAARFVQRACQALNLFLPPPYMIGLYERHLSLFRPLAWLDRRAGRLPVVNQAGDHFLMVMSRRG